MDGPYLRQDISSSLEMIFSEEHKGIGPLLYHSARAVEKEYKKIFPLSSHYRKRSIVFLPSIDQRSVGIAKMLPLPAVYVYPSPMKAIDSFAFYSWHSDILLHEMAHLYQMGFQTDYSRWLSFFLPKPLFSLVYPNLFSHPLIMEGHAVLLESMYGSGGRLFSGWTRAFVFAQLKAGFSLKRIFQQSARPFSHKEKYRHGAYFYSYLIEKADLRKINSFFYFSSRNTLFPFGYFAVSRAFKKSLGKSLAELFKGYKSRYLPMAMRQKSSPEPAILSSRVSLPLNSGAANIYFLISDRKSPPRLVILNKKTGQIRQRKTNMPEGKVFLAGKDYCAAGAGQTGVLSREFSLFKEGFIPLRKYNSQYVQDMREGKTLSMDSSEGLAGVRLNINGGFYDYTHSSAVLDHKGRPCYFRQKGDQRILYRGKKPLKSFKGYYGFPVEADSSGIYFVSSTKYGSGLFVFRNGEIFRLSPSDTIVAARKVSRGKFLVSEAGPEKYEYKIIQTSPVREEPFLYRYGFEKTALFKEIHSGAKERAPAGLAEKEEAARELARMTEDPPEEAKTAAGKKPEAGLPAGGKRKPAAAAAAAAKAAAGDERKKTAAALKRPYAPFRYSPLANFRFQSSQIRFLSFPKFNWIFDMDLRFTDPLEQNAIRARAFLAGAKGLSLSYTNSVYRTIFRLGGSYELGSLSEASNKGLLETLKHLDLLKDSDMWEKASLFGAAAAGAWDIYRKKKRIHYKDTSLQAAFQYPIFRKENWGLSFLKQAAFSAKRFDGRPPWRFSINHTGRLIFHYNRAYPYAFSNYRDARVDLMYDVIHVKKRGQKTKYDTYSSGEAMFFLEAEAWRGLYFTVTGRIRRKIWDRRPQHIFFNGAGRSMPLNYHHFGSAARNLDQAGARIQKPLNQSLYHMRVPIALRRWAPFAGFSAVSLQPRPKTKRAHLLHSFLGAEFELSLNHNVIGRAGVSGGYVWPGKKKPRLAWGFYTNLEI